MALKGRLEHRQGCRKLQLLKAMKGKRVLLAFAMAFLASCGIVHAAQKFTVANSDGVNIKYEVVSEAGKTVKVTSADKAENIVIPERVVNNGSTYTVIAIGKAAFGKRVRSVVLPNTLKLIESYAFNTTTNLESIEIPEGVEEIGYAAFAYSGVTSVQLPNTLLKIGDYAFTGVDQMTSINIPNSVKHIGKDAFANGGTQTSLKDWTFNYLPPIVTEVTCERMGISRISVTAYLTEHPRTTQPQQQVVYVQAPQQTVTQPSATLPNAPSSDVDVDIPTVAESNMNTFAVIIANENYQEEVKVDYALNDGETFKQYCQKVLGLPEKNIHIRKDATLNNIKAELSWLQQVADAYGGEARFIVFYAGHGIPDEKSGTAYLLPVDGKGTMLDTGFSLAQFYKQLGEMPSQGVTVFMDACFSGSKRGDGMLASARGVAIKAKAQVPQGRMVVFSAAQGDETAYPYKEKEHGLFTYYILKKLKETRGNVSLEDLARYVTIQVKRESIVSNGKSQTPTVSASASVGDTWKAQKLK